MMTRAYPANESTAGGHTPAVLLACPPRSPRSQKGQAVAQTLPPASDNERLDRIEAAIKALSVQLADGLRTLGFSVTVVASEVGYLAGEQRPAARPVPAPRPAGHLRALPDPAAQAPLPQSWAGHQQASAAAFEAATRR
jgi:hypothetical protein